MLLQPSLVDSGLANLPEVGALFDSGFIDAPQYPDARVDQDSGRRGMDANDVDAGLGYPREVTLGGPGRPAIMHIPKDYDGQRALPIILQLHGYTMNADVQESYFRMASRVDSRQFFLVRPNGTIEASFESHRFWNAIPNACCNFYRSSVDDVSYLLGLIDEAKARFSVDASRVYLIGYSNGGFMSYRMACDHADQITAIVSLAGSTFLNEADCNASEPVSVLQIHGDRDTIVPYFGLNMNGYAYPGAQETVERWATRAGCDVSESEIQPSFDLDGRVRGDETEVLDYIQGCRPEFGVSLWRIRNGTHTPGLSSSFRDGVLNWLFQYQK
ncbi:MAG: PHB depolymerase family esterase [Myxococcota bacterium]|nr:PHB depolymerase family esterase [Myxococcota bacterium]